jgi:hypothetical protein
MRNNIDVSQLTHLRDGIYRAFEGEIYGYPVCILATKMQPEFDMGDYYCGYVGVPPSHSLYQKEFMDNIMVQVRVTMLMLMAGLHIAEWQTVGERQKMSLKTIGSSASTVHIIGMKSIPALLKMLKPIANVWLWL